MKLPSKSLERKLFADGYEQIIGIDEVGMGCLAGPVVVCAVSLNKDFYKKSHKKLRRLRDSKMLLPHQRENFARELLKFKNLKFKISYCYPKTIDKLNIYQAARKAMRRAVKKLSGKSAIRPTLDPRLFAARRSFLVGALARLESPREFSSGCMADLLKTIVLIDGKTIVQGLPLEQMAIVKGDRKVFAIACASIIAKVFRDKMMIKYAKKFPGYGFEKHKGYGTKEHRAQLAKLGSCAIHRKSFAPVFKLV